MAFGPTLLRLRLVCLSETILLNDVRVNDKENTMRYYSQDQEDAAIIADLEREAEAENTPITGKQVVQTKPSMWDSILRK